MEGPFSGNSDSVTHGGIFIDEEREKKAHFISDSCGQI